MINTVTVRWVDGYLEEFRAEEVRFGGDLLWMRLESGTNRHIPLRSVRWFGMTEESHQRENCSADTRGKQIQIVNLPSAQQWIPCSERMPEIAKDVLTTYIDGETKIRHVREDAWLPNDDSEKGGWCNEEDDYRYNGLNMEVIAWMPLPEPYKEE